MVIPLEGRKRWLFALSLGLPLLGYLVLGGKEFAASHFAARPDLTSLERAVRLSPGNADYRHRLGRYFAFVASDPQSATANFQVATALNPHAARYWFDLASAQQVAGNQKEIGRFPSNVGCRRLRLQRAFEGVSLPR